MPDPTQHTTTIQWLGSLYKIMGKEKADKFVRDLGATKPLLVESFAPSAERVANRRNAHRHYPDPIRRHLQRERCAGGLCRLGKMLSIGQYLALSNKAPRPNGGKAFIDFFLGDESMRILAKMGEFVNRKGIHPPLAGRRQDTSGGGGRLRRQGIRGKDPRVSEDFPKIGEGNHGKPRLSARRYAPA